MTIPGRKAARRVVHVVRSDAFAGVERYITYVAPALRRRGVDVVVIGGDPRAMAAALGPAGVRHLGATTTLQAVRQLVRCRPVDLVHTHMAAAEVAAVTAAPVTRAPIVTTRHFAARRGRSPAGRLAAPVVDAAVRCEIAISRFVARAIGRPCVVVPNGVPDQALASGAPPVVLMAQRLESEKDVGAGIRAWAAAGLETAGWRLVVAGEGSMAPELRRLAASEGVAASVDFVGRHDGLDALLSRAAIFLSTAPAEPFGLSVVEAMARGVPVVAAAGGGHLETVGCCTTEWLFPPGDHATCAERVTALVADEAGRTAYGRQLQEVQRRCFGLEAHVDRLVALYDAVDKGPG